MRITKEDFEKIEGIVKRGWHESVAEMFQEALIVYATSLITYIGGGEVKITIGKESIDLTKDIESLRKAKQKAQAVKKWH